MSKKPNPILKKKYDEGYQHGFKNGLEHGKYIGVSAIAEKIEALQDMKGIGPKTFDKIMDAIGREYFEGVEMK